MLVVCVSQDEHRCPVHNQAQDCDEDRLAEGDRYRVGQPIEAFSGHQQGENDQQDGARKPTQGVRLARAKAIARVVRVAPGVDVGKDADAQCCSVRGHVQSVGQQRHRAEKQAGGDLGDHHNSGNGDHDQRPLFCRSPDPLTKVMGMLPQAKIGVMHGVLSLFSDSQAPALNSSRSPSG